MGASTLFWIPGAEASSAAWTWPYRPAAPHPEHRAGCCRRTCVPRRGLQRSAAEPDPVLALRLHPRGRNRPHRAHRVDLASRSSPDRTAVSTKNPNDSLTAGRAAPPAPSRWPRPRPSAAARAGASRCRFARPAPASPCRRDCPGAGPGDRSLQHRPDAPALAGLPADALPFEHALGGIAESRDALKRGPSERGRSRNVPTCGWRARAPEPQPRRRARRHRVRTRDDGRE